MEKYALDTDLLIDFLRGREPAVSAVEKLKETGFLAATLINVFELYWGAYKFGEKRVEDVRKLLDKLELLSLYEKIAEKAGEEIAHLEKIGLLIDVRDLLIGVIAREQGYSIVTGNMEHFQRIRGLKIINWKIYRFF